MPGFDEVQLYLGGVVMLLRNRAEGFNRLDMTADGFWRSFAAMVYALPAFALSWASYRAGFLEASMGRGAAGAGFILRLAIVDGANWIAPLVLLALLARPLGLARNYGRFVIATNWLGLVTSYVMAVPVLVSLVGGVEAETALFVSLVLFALTIAAFFRVTRMTLDGDTTMAAVVTIGMIAASVLVTSLLQRLLGLAAA